MPKKTEQVGRSGKYDGECERLSMDFEATAVVLIVVGGRWGNGMSVAIDPAQPGAFELAHGGGLAARLRFMADVIEKGEAPSGARVTVQTKGDS